MAPHCLIPRKIKSQWHRKQHILLRRSRCRTQTWPQGGGSAKEKPLPWRRETLDKRLKSLFLQYTNCTTQRISVCYEIVKVIGSFNLQTTSTEKKALHFNEKKRKYNTISCHTNIVSQKSIHNTKHQILTGGKIFTNFLSKQCVIL